MRHRSSSLIERHSYEVPGFSHGANPIPAASRIGNIVATGGISGVDLASGVMPDSLEVQCANMFALMERILEAAGASVANVIKMTVYMKPGLKRDAVNAEWIKRFPDPHARPVRHTIVNEHLAGDMLVQCEVMAVTAA
jgi:2-iminobutanoate/2-iminopropanoate deaminase